MVEHEHLRPQAAQRVGPAVPRGLPRQSITAREVFRRVPSVKEQLWGEAFWSRGFFINSVGRHGSEETMRQ